MQKERHNIGRQIVNELGQRIVRGDIQPGEVMPNEQTLTQEYGVSRTVIREALKGLAARGLIESRAKVGTTVRPRSDWHLWDADMLAWVAQAEPPEKFLRRVLEVWRVVQPPAAALAAERATAEDIARIEHYFAQMQALVIDQDVNVRAFVSADLNFHLQVVAACHNDFLEQISRSICSAFLNNRDVATAAIERALLTVPDKRKSLPAESLALREATLNAIRNRDAEAAYASEAALIRHVEKTFTEAFRLRTSPNNGSSA